MSVPAGLPSTSIGMFLKTKWFFVVVVVVVVFKQYASTRSLFKPFSPVHMKYDRILYRACVMLLVDDVFENLFICPHVNEKPASSKISAVKIVNEQVRFWVPESTVCLWIEG